MKIQSIMNAYGDGQTVPAWTSSDYASLCIVGLTYSSNGWINAQFERDSAGLNGRPTSCPR